MVGRLCVHLINLLLKLVTVAILYSCVNCGLAQTRVMRLSEGGKRQSMVVDLKSVEKLVQGGMHNCLQF